MWSEEGKSLLIKIQGRLYVNDFTPEPVHGSHMVDWIEEWFGGDFCLYEEEEDNNDDDLISKSSSLDPFFLALAAQRGCDTAFIPIYDLINHHSGKINIEFNPSI